MMLWFFGFSVGCLVSGAAGLFFGAVIHALAVEKTVRKKGFSEVLEFAEKTGGSVHVSVVWPDADDDGGDDDHPFIDDPFVLGDVRLN